MTKLRSFFISLKAFRWVINSSTSMSTVFTVRSFLYCFHIYGHDGTHCGGTPALTTWVFLPLPLSRDRLGSISSNEMSHLRLSSRLTRGDKCIHCGWGIWPCPPLVLVPNTFPLVDALDFSISPILVSLFCDLKNHPIVNPSLPVRRFLIINLIEQGYLLVVGYPMIF
jgi:hypothetical protein